MKVLDIKLLLFLLFFSLQLNSQTRILVVTHSKFPYSEFLLAAYEDIGIKSLKKNTSDDKGFTLFGFDSLASGLYYIIFPDSSSVEFMIDADFQEKTSIRFNEFSGSFSVEGSAVTKGYNQFNVRFQELSKNEKNTVINSFYSAGNSNAKSQVNILIDTFALKFSGSVLASYLTALKNIEIPAYNPPVDVTNKDSAIWQHQLTYFQKHFLDNLNLADIRLSRTPVYSDLIYNYLDRTISQTPQSLSDGIDFLVQKSSGNVGARDYLVRFLYNKYYTKRNGSLGEFLLIHIMEEYIFKTGCNWMSDSELTELTREYNKRKPASLLQTAPEISWTDETGNTRQLSKVQTDFVVIYFYSYDCPVCAKTTPDLRKTISTFNYLNSKVVAICLGNSQEEWKNYIVKNDLNAWMNTSAVTIQNDDLRKYNLTLTPTLFLLDKNKTIISKNITIAQLNEYFLEVALNETSKH